MIITKSKLADMLAFAIAILWFVYVQVVGNLYLSELMLIVVFIFMFKRYGYLLLEPLPKHILLFGSLWLLSQVVTDLVRMTPLESLLKGWASIGFFLIDFAALYMLLYKNTRRLKLFIIGFALGGLLRPLFYNEYGFDVELWKFGYGLPTTILVIFAISWAVKKKVLIPLLGYLFLLMLGGVSFYLNARALGGTILLTVLLLWLSKSRLFKQLFLIRLNPAKKTGLILVAMLAISLVLVSYQWIGEAELLPENAQYKYELNKTSSFGLFGIIFAGRNEILASIPAVIDSPIIGHGSWAEDARYRAYLYEAHNILGTNRDEEQLKRFIESKDSIPAHSHLMQSWVWAGVLGGIFWLYLLKLTARAAISSIKYPSPLTMLILFVCIKAIWDLLFSPFSSFMRILWAWELVLILTAISAGGKLERRPE